MEAKLNPHLLHYKRTPLVKMVKKSAMYKLVSDMIKYILNKSENATPLFSVKMAEKRFVF